MYKLNGNNPYKMNKKEKWFYIFLISSTLFLLSGLLTKVYAEEENFSVPSKVSEYVYDCDKIDRVTFNVCWNYDGEVPLAGWSFILKDFKDTGNISKRPTFFKDKEVTSLLPNDYNLPFHRGHTFANDGDNDFDQVNLKRTYNMLNITPMYGVINTNQWKLVERKGRELSDINNGPKVLSITLIKYPEESKLGFFPGTKINYSRIPTSYIRIYYIEETQEEYCYEVKNSPVRIKNDTLSDYQIDCESIKIKDGINVDIN